MVRLFNAILLMGLSCSLLRHKNVFVFLGLKLEISREKSMATLLSIEDIHKTFEAGTVTENHVLKGFWISK